MRLIDSHPIVWTREHETVIICVAVQSNPLTKYRWHKLNVADNFDANSNDNLDSLVSKLLNKDIDEDNNNGDNMKRKSEFVDLSSFVQATKATDSSGKDDMFSANARMLPTDSTLGLMKVNGESVNNLMEQNFKANRIFQHDSCLVIDSATTKDSGKLYAQIVYTKFHRCALYECWPCFPPLILF